MLGKSGEEKSTKERKEDDNRRGLHDETKRINYPL